MQGDGKATTLLLLLLPAASFLQHCSSIASRDMAERRENLAPREAGIQQHQGTPTPPISSDESTWIVSVWRTGTCSSTQNSNVRRTTSPRKSPGTPNQPPSTRPANQQPWALSSILNDPVTDYSAHHQQRDAAQLDSPTSSVQSGASITNAIYGSHSASALDGQPQSVQYSTPTDGLPQLRPKPGAQYAPTLHAAVPTSQSTTRDLTMAGIPISSSGGQNVYQMMTLETTSGPVQLPVDVQAASRVADEKKKRNAGASARFRQRRKEKEKEASTTIAKLEQQVRELSEEAAFYRRERDIFKKVLSTIPGCERHLQRLLRHDSGDFQEHVPESEKFVHPPPPLQHQSPAHQSPGFSAFRPPA